MAVEDYIDIGLFDEEEYEERLEIKRLMDQFIYDSQTAFKFGSLKQWRVVFLAEHFLGSDFTGTTYKELSDFIGKTIPTLK